MINLLLYLILSHTVDASNYVAYNKVKTLNPKVFVCLLLYVWYI